MRALTLGSASFLALLTSCSSLPPTPSAAHEPAEADPIDALSTGPLGSPWTVESGRFAVVEDATAPRGSLVVAQLAQSEVSAFNVALSAEATGDDVTGLAINVRAVDGAIDRGGGLVWRARDARNYCIARWNPLESNVRAYTVVDGKRTQIASAEAPSDSDWHELRVALDGARITVSIDGAAAFSVEDATFDAGGRAGLWTKADARTHFDGLTIERSAR